MSKKCIILTSMLFAASAAQAATPGPFVDMSVGAGMVRTPNQFAFGVTEGDALVKRKLGGFAWRVAGGYNFNKYFGLEAAYLRPAKSTYSADGDFGNASLSYSDNVAEALVDAYLPVSSTFDFYTKVGVAYIRQNVKYQNSSPDTLPVNTDAFSSDLASGNYSAFGGVIGAGMGYSFTPSTMINMGVSYILMPSDSFADSSSAVADVSYASLGFRYTFPSKTDNQ
jgi:hypothetical protein